MPMIIFNRKANDVASQATKYKLNTHWLIGGFLFMRQQKKKKKNETASTSFKMECDFYEIDIST